MLISIEKKITFLAMTKAASTSIEMALAPRCDIAYYGNPRVKHISYRRYSRFVAPYLASLGYNDIETCCLFREPVDWLFSWYRYRSRPEIAGRPQSTAGLSFDEFACLYLAGSPTTKGVGRPSKFVADKDGTPSVTHIFKYDNLPAFRKFIENRFGEPLHLDRLNESPAGEFILSPQTRTRLTEFFAPEYEIYEAAR